MAEVEIYATEYCPYCVRAKRLLREKGADFREYDVAQTGREEMIRRAGGRGTVPQIFIDGRHIGGCDDLFELEEEGRLDAMLEAQA